MCICKIRAFFFNKCYTALREHYFSLLKSKAISTDEEIIINSVRNRIRDRNWKSLKKDVGQIHTCLIFRNTGWQNSLLNELKLLGQTTVIDYHVDNKDEIIWNERPRWLSVREELHRETISRIKQIHSKNPIDWLFCYFDGKFVLRETVECIQMEIGIPTVKMSLDDKNYWDGPKKGGQKTGQIDLAEVFDLSWSSARTTVGWYCAEGGRAIYLPEGFDPSEYYTTNSAFNIPVSFVGACYGVRPTLVGFLKKHGIDVQVFGDGWGKIGNGFAASPCDIFNRSQINLGCGYIGHSAKLTNVKGRDFEIAGTGGGAYLTTFNSDLTQHFEIGKEILCYHSFDECLELVRYYIQRPQECRALANRARQRCLREHRWLHRYIKICQHLNILNPNESPAQLVKEAELKHATDIDKPIPAHNLSRTYGQI